MRKKSKLPMLRKDSTIYLSNTVHSVEPVWMTLTTNLIPSWSDQISVTIQLLKSRRSKRIDKLVSHLVQTTPKTLGLPREIEFAHPKE
jgi:hypothetical protein